MTGMTGLACREIRQLIGIHMVGASQEAMAVRDRRWSLPVRVRQMVSRGSGVAGSPAMIGE